MRAEELGNSERKRTLKQTIGGFGGFSQPSTNARYINTHAYNTVH